MRNARRVAVGLLVLITCTTIPALAQADTCTNIVDQALVVTGANCAAVGRNEVCYGNVQLVAEPQADVTDFVFAAPGDVAALEAVRTLNLSSRLEDSEEWGIALMRVQADVPDALPGENLTLVLFGEVEVENAAEAEANPMQAFFFETGLRGTQCTEAPDSGILVQTPDGYDEISFTANDVDIRLGSTAFLQGEAEAEMIVSVVEGQATVTAQGVTVVVPAGSRTRIPLDSDRRASGPPSPPEPYDFERMSLLPISLLPRTITIAEPIDATPEPPSGGGLIPAAGEYQWQWVRAEASSSGCPDGTLEFVVRTFADPPPFRLPGDEFDMVILGTAAFSSNAPPPPDAVSTNPEPGVYRMDFEDAGGVGHYEVQVIDANSMEGTMTYTSQGCAITLPFTASRVGD